MPFPVWVRETWQTVGKAQLAAVSITFLQIYTGLWGPFVRTISEELSEKEKHPLLSVASFWYLKVFMICFPTVYKESEHMPAIFSVCSISFHFVPVRFNSEWITRCPPYRLLRTFKEIFIKILLQHPSWIRHLAERQKKNHIDPLFVQINPKKCAVVQYAATRPAWEWLWSNMAALCLLIGQVSLVSVSGIGWQMVWEEPVLQQNPWGPFDGQKPQTRDLKLSGLTLAVRLQLVKPPYMEHSDSLGRKTEIVNSRGVTENNRQIFTLLFHEKQPSLFL